MTRLTRKLLLAFSVLGLGASIASSVVHYRLLTQPGYTSFCDVNATVSCTEAYLSRYGTFAGVPIALGGVVFFALVLLMAWIGGRAMAPVRENLTAYIFALSTIGLAFVLYLAWASFFVLKAFCVLCVITYVAVIALFVVSGGATTFPMTTLPRRAARDLRTLVTTPLALGIAVLFVAGAFALAALFPRETGTTAEAAAPAQANFPPLTDAERTQFEAWWDAQPKVDMPIPNDGAKVLVVKFNDYQCPPCRQSFEAYKGIFAKHNAQVKYVLKHYPLEPECNPDVPNGNHFAACEAAAAVVMARSKGTVAKLEQWLFDNQGTGRSQLNPDQVRQAAQDVGGISDFAAQYERALLEVRNDAGMGKLLGVHSTPTFFINGRRIAGMLQPRAFDAAIELELRRAK
jgi:uncharacterized membrane protein/protein-disulfide isomerase